jgi:AcrR family transcriptional regulator
MRRIQLAALTLFERHGFERVTIEDIARAARVGPATVYRNFITKERIVLWDEYDPMLVTGVAERLATESLIDATRDALVAGLNAVYRRDRRRILRRMRLLADSPSMRAEATQNLASLRVALSAVYLKKRAVPSQLAANVIAGVVISTLEAAIDTWAAQAARRSLQFHVTRAFAVLDTISACPARRLGE